MLVLPRKYGLEYLLALFPKYFQQLLMESPSTEIDLARRTMHQWITVSVNKCSTGQHIYVKLFTNILCNLFVVLIEVMNHESHSYITVEPEIISELFPYGFHLGTCRAVTRKRRETITITIKDNSVFTVGMSIAWFETAVGLYASLININANHQPDVQSVKKASNNLIAIQRQVLEFVSKRTHQLFAVIEIAMGIKAGGEVENVFKICEHLSSNPTRSVKKVLTESSFAAKYSFA